MGERIERTFTVLPLTVRLCALTLTSFSVVKSVHLMKQNRHAEDYTRIEGQAGETLTVEVAPGGGFAAIFTK